MRESGNQKYLVLSFTFHVIIFLALVLNREFTAPLAVIENTNQHDVISAVVLGDTAKSKILPHEAPPPPVATPPKPEPVVKETPPPVVKKPEVKPEVDKEAIALKKAEEKKVAEKKLAEKKLAEKKAQELKKKKQQELFAKDLLADIKKQHDSKAKPKPKLQDKFAKTLREQSEQSLRQNLLNEKIKLSGKLSRQAQGVVDKYTALIVQAIGEHWLVPLQANKKLKSELMIRLGPGGNVIDVQIKKSSGDPSLDSSARAAVLKASPLPVPETAAEFEPFRQFVLTVKPENIVES
jgi:colicin import membrane protein